MDLICTVPRPHLLDRRLIWPGHFGARSFGHFSIISFKFSKAYWIRFSRESFIGFHIWGCPFSTGLGVFIYLWSSNSMEKVVLKTERWLLMLHLVPPTLVANERCLHMEPG